MITGFVVDKFGHKLTDKELNNKIIDSVDYYDLMLPIREKINNQYFSTKEMETKNSWNPI